MKAKHIARMSSNNHHHSWVIKKQWQYFIIACIVLMDLIVSLIWMFTFEKPRLEDFVVDHKRRELSCNYGNSFKGVILWCFYNGGKQ